MTINEDKPGSTNRGGGEPHLFNAVAGLPDRVAGTVRHGMHNGRTMAAERWAQLRERTQHLELPRIRIDLHRIDLHRIDLPRIDLHRIQISDLRQGTRDAYAGLAGRGRQAVGAAWETARPMAEKLFQHQRGEEKPVNRMRTGDEAQPTKNPTEQ